MNIKHRLTIAMWALPFPFIMVVFGGTKEIIGIGIILIVIQCLVWHNLLSEIK